MADYKAIHGKNILSLASDLDNAEAEGEIWFNTASEDYKTVVKVAGTWSTGGTMNTARDQSAGFGTREAFITAGGSEPSVSDKGETYDGSAWTEGGDLNTARRDLRGSGTATAGLVAGGTTGSITGETETYDGSSWTEVADLNTGNHAAGIAGAT